MIRIISGNLKGRKLHNYKNASIFSDNTICLPIGPHLEKKELNFIAKTLEKEIKEYV